MILPLFQLNASDAGNATMHYTQFKTTFQVEQETGLFLGLQFCSVLKPLGAHSSSHQSKDIFEILQTVIHKCGIFATALL